MRLDVILADLLYTHNCVVVPNFGGFLAKEIGAEVQPGTHMMRPPRKRISFNARLVENDGLLAHTYARLAGMEYNLAAAHIEAVAKAWQRDLEAGKKIVLDRLGKLYADEQGNVQFSPSLEEHFLASSFGLGIFRATPLSSSAPAAVKPSADAPLKVVAPTINKTVFKPWMRAAAIALPLLGLSWYASFQGVRFVESQSSSGLNILRFSRMPEANSVRPLLITPKYQPIELPEVIVGGEGIAEVAKPALATEAARGAYCIVTGSFQDAQNAENWIAQLRQRGEAAFMAPRSGKYYRVAVASFNTEGEARAALAKIQSRVHPGAWIFSK